MLNPNELHDRLEAKGREKARTAARHTTTDRLRKEVRAKVMVEHINAGKAIGTSEQLALIDPRYIEACERAEKAEEEAGVASVEYEAAKTWVDIWRSLEASERARMTLR